jgi:hypothetical protein
MEGWFSLRAHFRSFGFVVLPAALDAGEAAALATEADAVVRDATGTNYLVEPEGGGITGHYIPATGPRTPVSVGLLMRFAPVAEELAGVPLVPSVVQHILFFDCASWHTDTGHAVPSVKVVAYLEPLTADTGALRVLPGSHRLDERVLSQVLHGPAFRSEDSWRRAIRQVPCHVIETVPGDVIVFDEHLWHASFGGRHRHQWSAEFVLDPACPEEELAVRAYLASQFSPDYSLDYDPTHYPYYGPALRSEGPARWIAQLDRLGALAAADAEQGRLSEAMSPASTTREG